MKQIISTFSLILSIFLINNIMAEKYVLKIVEEKSAFVIDCSTGYQNINNACMLLIAKIDKCPNGFEDHSATECKSLTPEIRTRLCQSGYTYNSGSQQCQRTIGHGSADGRCGGGLPGCSAIVSPSQCFYTCDDGSSHQGWYYENCSTGYASNGYCYSTDYQPYSLPECGTGFIEDGDGCLEIVDKLLNVCPDGKTDLDENNCY